MSLSVLLGLEVVLLMLMLTEGIGLMLANFTSSASTLHILVAYCHLIVLGLLLLPFQGATVCWTGSTYSSFNIS
jgi:hypothetical protein